MYNSTSTFQKTPLYTAFQDLLEIEGFEFKSTSLIKEAPNQIKECFDLYRPRKESYSFFKKFLERITTYLEKAREEWKGGHEANRLVTLDTSTEFFRIWAICQFIFCMVDKKATTTDMETFGHGMIWGGTTLVYLFGQYLRYEAFNFCDHVLNISTLVKEKKKK